MATTFHVLIGDFEFEVKGHYVGPQRTEDEYRDARSQTGCDLAQAMGGNFTFAEDDQ